MGGHRKDKCPDCGRPKSAQRDRCNDCAQARRRTNEPRARAAAAATGLTLDAWWAAHTGLTNAECARELGVSEKWVSRERPSRKTGARPQHAPRKDRGHDTCACGQQKRQDSPCCRVCSNKRRAKLAGAAAELAGALRRQAPPPGAQRSARLALLRALWQERAQ